MDRLESVDKGMTCEIHISPTGIRMDLCVQCGRNWREFLLTGVDINAKMIAHGRHAPSVTDCENDLWESIGDSTFAGPFEGADGSLPERLPENGTVD